MELNEQPTSLIIIGGGYIGAELGHFFSALGTRVTVINPAEKLLREDEDIRELFTREFGKQVKLVIGKAVEAKTQEDGKAVLVEDDKGKRRTVIGEQILLAAGRAPNSDGLELETTGVEIDERGFICVDEHLRTAHENIYAYGDILGRGMFKHTSSYEGELAYCNSQGASKNVSYRANPHAVFSHPQIAAVGLTERECRERNLDYNVLRANYEDVAKGKIVGEPGFAKLIVERGSDRILGFHIIGPDAPALIHEVVVAMNAGDGKAATVRRAIHIHPTLSELVQSVFAKSR